MILSSIWRVYSVLMEYANSTDYNSQIMCIIEESNRMLNEKEVQFQKLLNNAEEKLESNQEYVEDISNKYHRTKADLKEARNKIQQLKNDIHSIKATNENEVHLRMKFEERMNYLHALNRSFN